MNRLLSVCADRGCGSSGYAIKKNSLREIHEAIVGDKFKDRIERIREVLGEGDDPRDLKGELRVLMPSSHFKGNIREQAEIVYLTGKIQIDLDKTDDPEGLIEKCYAHPLLKDSIALDFVSPSGRGSKLLIDAYAGRVVTDANRKQELAKHQWIYDIVSDFFDKEIHKNDHSCIDPAKPCYFSHYPKARFNARTSHLKLKLFPTYTPYNEKQTGGKKPVRIGIDIKDIPRKELKLLKELYNEVVAEVGGIEKGVNINNSLLLLSQKACKRSIKEHYLKGFVESTELHDLDEKRKAATIRNGYEFIHKRWEEEKNDKTENALYILGKKGGLRINEYKLLKIIKEELKIYVLDNEQKELEYVRISESNPYITEELTEKTVKQMITTRMENPMESEMRYAEKTTKDQRAERVTAKIGEFNKFRYKIPVWDKDYVRSDESTLLKPFLNGVLMIDPETCRLIAWEDFNNHKKLRGKYFKETEVVQLNLQDEPDTDAFYINDFLNKIGGENALRLKTSIGYVLHPHKRSSYAKMPLLIDEPKDLDNIGQNRDGQRGKTRVLTFIEAWVGSKAVLHVSSKELKNNNNFPFSGLTDDIRIIHAQELSEWSAVQFVEYITDTVYVNEKSKVRRIVLFKDFPKLIGTSNWLPKIISQGDTYKNRFEIVPITKYFHAKKTPYDEYGKYFLEDEWGAIEDGNKSWSDFFWTMARQCIQPYLKLQKIAPMQDESDKYLRQASANNDFGYHEAFMGYMISELNQNHLQDESTSDKPEDYDPIYKDYNILYIGRGYLKYQIKQSGESTPPSKDPRKWKYMCNNYLEALKELGIVQEYTDAQFNLPDNVPIAYSEKLKTGKERGYRIKVTESFAKKAMNNEYVVDRINRVEGGVLDAETVKKEKENDPPCPF